MANKKKIPLIDGSEVCPLFPFDPHNMEELARDRFRAPDQDSSRTCNPCNYCKNLATCIEIRLPRERRNSKE